MERISIWVDGCCNKEGSGWAVICPSQKLILRGKFPGATNQQAELGAVIQAVNRFGSYLIIYTDSMYTIGCFRDWFENWQRNGWKNAKGKPVENQPLIKLGLQLGANKAIFQHVKGHSGDQYNEMADYYCKGGLLKDSGWTLIE
jgi:ribonuclease HI|uniref:ribonuclease H n=1 Tax=viral metagenome TaxID=1070528 RepID=A0A6C0IYV8_9ZZZZ